MKAIFPLLVWTALCSACGTEKLGSTLEDQRPVPGFPESMMSDQDISVISLQAWIDLMPGLGVSSTPKTRLQVRFYAPSFGCTTGDNFESRIIDGPDVQTIVIKKVRIDSCKESMFRTEINHTVDGHFVAGKPVYMNGAEIPVFESIIN